MKLVLTLWPAVVAEVLGFDHDEALTLVVNGTSYLPPVKRKIFSCDYAGTKDR
jgi:hypothetical protein